MGGADYIFDDNEHEREKASQDGPPSLINENRLLDTEKPNLDSLEDIVRVLNVNDSDRICSPATALVGNSTLGVNVVVTFPEGGVHGWCVIVGGFIVQFCCFGYINSFGVYQDFYVREYLTNVTPSDIGWIGGVQIFLTFSFGAISGRVFDRGYWRYLLIGSTVIYAVSLFMLSLAHKHSYYQIFLTNGVGLGLATGMTYTPSLAIVGHYFSKRRPLFLGIVSSGSAVGAVFHPILVNKLINGPIGFANGVRISASINVALLLIATFIMKTRLPPKENQTFPLLKWIQEPIYFFVTIGGILVFAGIFFPAFYLQLDAIQHNVPRNLAFYVISIINASSFFGRTLPGVFAAKLGVYNLGVSFIVASGIVTLCMMLVRDVAGTVLFAMFYGVFTGATVALVPSLLATTAKDMNEVGTRMGFYFGIGGILGLFATPISGALLTRQYHWNRAIAFSGVTMIFGGVFFGVARMFLARERGTQRV